MFFSVCRCLKLKADMNDMKISAHVMTCWLAFFKDNRDNFLHERKMGGGAVGRNFRLIFQLKNCPYCLYCL